MKTLDRSIDSDGDGLTDYYEMIWFRNPWIKGPIPKKLSSEELDQALIESQKQAKIHFDEQKEKWAERKKLLEPSKGKTPKDEVEEQKKLDEDAKKAIEKLHHDCPPLEWNTAFDSLVQINHAKANIVQHDAGTGRKLWGSGQTVALAESGPPSGIHPDLSGRISVHPSVTGNPNSHTTATASVIASSGNSNNNGKGIASQALVVVHNAVNNPDKQAKWDAMKSIDISAHPYSMEVWTEGAMIWPVNQPATDTFYYRFHSRPDVSRDEPNFCGMYTGDAAFIDIIKKAAPHHVYVQSASNVRGQDFPNRFNVDSSGQPATGYDQKFAAFDHNNQWYVDDSYNYPWSAGHADGGKDSLPPLAISKNALVVGGILQSDAPTGGSGWGPTDDHRIKPDLAAVSYDVTAAYSYLNGATEDPSDYTFGYSSFTGNSYSVPAVAAGAALIAECRSQKNLPKFKGATIKGLLLATARDIGVPGPDPQTGWGAMNLYAAAKIVVDDKNSTHIKEVEVKNGGPVNFRVKSLLGTAGGLVPSNMRLKVFICWDDPAFSPNATTYGTIDQNIKTLSHDLDLVVTRVVTPADPDPYEPVAINVGTGNKTFAVNTVDNVECVEVYEEGIFDIEVRASNTLTAPQPVSIIIQGLDPAWSPEPGGGEPNPGGSGVKPSAAINQTDVDEFTVTWPSIAGRVYDLESSPDLVNWTTVAAEVTANSWFTSYPVPILDEKGFYRVVDLDDPEDSLPPIAPEP